MGVRRVRGLKRDGPVLAIAFKVLTRRLLRRGARYSKNIFSPLLGRRIQLLKTQHNVNR